MMIRMEFARGTIGLWLPSCLLFILLAGCGGGGSDANASGPPSASATRYHSTDAIIPTSGLDVPDGQSLDQTVTTLLKKWDVVGATFAIAKNGRLIFARGYGYSDYEARQVMQPDAMMRIASISKALTGLAILRLKDEGLLRLEERMVDILPEYPLPAGADARLRDITITHLLQHSAGWDRRISGDPFNQVATIANSLGLDKPALCPDMIRYMLGRPLDFTPGTRFAYSNFGFCVLGRIVEKVSGQPYELYVRDHVLAPADVHAMSIGKSHANERGQFEVKYYMYMGAPPVQSLFPGEGRVPAPYSTEVLTADSAAGWIASAIDLTRVMTAVDGSRVAQLLTPETMQLYIADPHLPGWSDPRYWGGLGILVGPTPTTWYADGVGSGGSLLFHDSREFVWAIMTSSLPQDAVAFETDLRATMEQAIPASFMGSSADLYAQYPSPSLPPRQQ
jgi:CubicO group peptidase (beta-lactamase class C family)